jgi:hypothetical protein
VAELEWLTFDQFSGRVGETFVVVADGRPSSPVELVEATESSEPGGPGPDGVQRFQFSLVFRGDPGLPQGTYRVSHADMGDFDLFLVPIGPDGDSMQYQAAFA